MNSDDQIIVGCLEGKRKAFSLLFERYSPVMLGVCMRYCKNRIDAEDVMQDGFIKVFGQIHKFRREGSFEGWIKRIMINSAIDNYQSNLKYAFHEDVSEIAQASALADYLDDDDDLPDEMNIPHGKLMEMIQELPDGYRMVFNLYAIESFNHKEIASLLGISENTSKSQLLKARKALRKRIDALLQHNHINRVITV
jgi:RNA polymerase sigma-70 factor (ECF subfamily)